MMFGHIETIEERIEHLLLIRQVQSEKPENSKGFIAFIPWPYQDEGTLLNKVRKVKNTVTADEYIRMIALSRILLPNIENIQASWLTVGKQTAQLCLYAGANDFGSIMIEENVVSAAGASHRFDAESIQRAIKEAGFIPLLRNQQYEKRDLPEILIKSNNLEKFNQTILIE
jgi:cyclic dehypoxanthinyl futalosine synthase